MKTVFFGGIHPADKKELTSHNSPFLCPESVVIPVSQHIGAPCKPLVNKGDYVFMGQKIGDGEGLCAPVHASVSGTVTEIGDMPHPNGSMVQAITIRNDKKDQWHPSVRPNVVPGELTAGELFRIIREAGIVGMGGATFPTEAKAASSLDHIDTLIINACECEPYITADDTLICTEPERILRGVLLLSQALKPINVFLAVESNKKQAIETLQTQVSKFPQITLKILPTRYPQGAEKQLIRTVTGREVPPGKLPASVGCAVFNVSTAAAVSQAVYQGIPLIHRIVTVTGEAVKEPQNFKVPIGTSFEELIRKAGGLQTEEVTVIAGGPMMGKAQSRLDVPVVKGSGAVLCLPKREKEENPTCIRCGKCMEVCPMHLQPLHLYRYTLAEDVKMLDQLNIGDCLECGCCAYTCPGRLSLVEQFRAGKRAWKEGK